MTSFKEVVLYFLNVDVEFNSNQVKRMKDF